MGGKALLGRVAAQLRAQTMPRWHALIVGDEPWPEGAAGSDPRFGRTRHRADDIATLGEAVVSTPCEFLLVLDPRDELSPGALEAMLDAAGANGHGAIGRYVFFSSLGVLPGDPLRGTSGVIEPAHWPSAAWAPANATLHPTRALLTVLNSVRPGEGWDYRLALALAAHGVRWNITTDAVAAFSLRPPVDAPRVEQGLLGRLADAAAFAQHLGLSRAACRDLLRPWGDALTTIRAAQALLRDCGEASLSNETRFPDLFARWWQRLGFYGAPPIHVLEANGRVAHAFARRPDLIAESLVDACDGATPVLLGLGRNARHVARVLRARGLPVRGHDDALTSPPPWSAEDGVHVCLLEGAPDPAATCIATPLNDAALVARLPARARVVRWSDAPERLARDHALAAIDHAWTAVGEPSCPQGTPA